MSLTLTVAHVILLDQDQRYKIADGEELTIVGVSIPTWYYNGETSEPATEVFCKYKIIPTKYKVFVKHTTYGYEIQLPLETHDPETNIRNPITLKNIRNIKDGGMEWLAFRQFGKIKRKNKKTIDIVHFVEIKSLQELVTTA